MADVTVSVRAAPALYTSFAQYSASGYVADGYLERFDVSYTVSGDAGVTPVGLGLQTAVGATSVSGHAFIQPAGLALIVNVGTVSVLTSNAQWAGAVAPVKSIARSRQRDEDAFLLCALL